MATFYWRGATANHPNSYDYNIASNWYYTTKIDTNNPSEMNNLKLVQATTPPGYGDVVKIGVDDQLNLLGVGATFSDNMDYLYTGATGSISKVFSPVSLSPLLYGGFSGGAAAGFWANGVGATGATGTTAASALKQFIVSQQLFNSGKIAGSNKAKNKYPFTSVGGGIEYAKNTLGLLDLGLTTANSMRNIDGTGSSAMADHYTSLKLKVNSFLEFSPYRIPSSIWGNEYSATTGHNVVNINFVKNIDSVGLPCTNIVKGDISTVAGLINPNPTYSNLYWSAISTPSCSWFSVNGFVNNINAKHAISATDVNLKRFNTTTGILDDGRTRIADVYLYGHLALKGVTASSVSNWAHSYTEVSTNATVGQVSISSLHGWATRGPNGGNTNPGLDFVSPICEIYGEINNKKARSALGYTGDALGQTGEGTLLVDFDLMYPSPSDRKWKYSGSAIWDDTDQGVQPVAPTVFLAGGDTFSSKIDQLIVGGVHSSQEGPMSMANPSGWTQGANIFIGGATNIGVARLDGCYVFSNAYQQTSLVNFGSLYLNGSVLDLRAQPEFNLWSFGVTSGAAGATSVVGGIFGDDKSVILTSNNLSLFNKTLRLGTNKTINREGVVSPLSFAPDNFATPL